MVAAFKRIEGIVQYVKNCEGDTLDFQLQNIPWVIQFLKVTIGDSLVVIERGKIGPDAKELCPPGPAFILWQFEHAWEDQKALSLLKDDTILQCLMKGFAQDILVGDTPPSESNKSGLRLRMMTDYERNRLAIRLTPKEFNEAHFLGDGPNEKVKGVDFNKAEQYIASLIPPAVSRYLRSRITKLTSEVIYPIHWS